MVKKTIGKNTLGDNNKMKVAMRDYERSKHNSKGKHGCPCRKACYKGNTAQ